MEDEKENDIPELVGLSKKQFFGFFLSSILMGAACFGLGYLFSFSRHTRLNSPSNAEHAKGHESSLGVKVNQGAVKDYLESNYNLPSENFIEISEEQNKNHPKLKKTFIIMGLFSSQSAATDLQKKLERIGKAAFIKNNGVNFTVFLGPYDSYDQAKNERDAIALTGTLSGSLVHDI